MWLSTALPHTGGWGRDGIFYQSVLLRSMTKLSACLHLTSKNITVTLTNLLGTVDVGWSEFCAWGRWFVFVKADVLIVIVIIPLDLWWQTKSNRHHLSYDDCLENKGRLPDCSCSIGSYHCIQCYAHILWAAPTGQTDLPSSHWVHFTVLRCICVFVFSCISLHACCIILTRWCGPGGIKLYLMTDHLPSVLWHCWLGHMTCKNIVPEWPILCRVGR